MRYRDGLKSLKQRRFPDAIAAFKELDTIYPGLRPFLSLHQAEAQAELGQEAEVQKLLRGVLAQETSVPVRAISLYRLGQSYFRGNDPKNAFKAFQTIRAEYPKTPYAVGSLFYMGHLALKLEPPDKREAARYWFEYLERQPDGRFSLDIADSLAQVQDSFLPDEELLLGQAYASHGHQPDKAVSRLRKAPLNKAWLMLGKALLSAQQRQEALKTIQNGFRYAKNIDQAREALDLLLRYTPEKEAKNSLLTMDAQQPAVGRDYLVWRLAQIDPLQASSYYKRILDEYPESDYAPESSWKLMWPLVQNREVQGYLARADEHLRRYPTARSSAQVLFWKAKLLETSGPSPEAIEAYREVINRYPISYYGYRASARLKAVSDGMVDTGWRTEASTSFYPPRVNTLLPPVDLAGLPKDQTSKAQVEELMAIGAADDVCLVYEQATGTLPVLINAWRLKNNGDRAGSIKLLREDLQRRGALGLKPDDITKRLLYPIYFPEYISREVTRNNLDPYLVQALMREESHFNELAVSGSNAMGLMQLLPSTARDVARWEDLPSFNPMDLFIPATNIRLGTRYLRFLHQQLDGNPMLAVGAYNGGPGAMRRWVDSRRGVLESDPDLFVEQIPYDEARDYIKKVFASYWNYRRLYVQGG